MSWYLKNGKDSDVILYSKSRLTRNLSKVKFNTANDLKDQKKVYEILKKITPKLGYSLKFIDYKTIDEVTKKSLLEKNIITKEFYNFKSNYKAVIINDEENIAIQVNGQDQIVLQVFQSGKSIEETTKLIIELDKKLEKLVNYAFNEKYGYLSPIITVSNTNQNCSELAELSFDGFALSSGWYSFYDIIKVMRKIVYIDGQNFLYKVSEILVKHGLVNDKQELNAIDIRSLFEKLFPNEELEIRFFGVTKN